jgi:hypothetical protein
MVRGIRVSLRANGSLSDLRKVSMLVIVIGKCLKYNIRYWSSLLLFRLGWQPKLIKRIYDYKLII